MDILKQYVDLFNANDEECYVNTVDNEHAYEWLKNEIPLLECPDKDIERTYYFRYWTYRKHVRNTEDGYVITEFLPKVPWSGKHNVINAAIGHHLYEGRWLKNAKTYVGQYVDYVLDTPDRSHQYSAWLSYAIMKLFEVTGEFEIGKELYKRLVAYYEKWEQTHGLSSGMFWSIDNYDAMEFSISGTPSDKKARKGIRPTLNSYMCADAYAIAEMAKKAGDTVTEQKFREKHEALKKQINALLFEDGFYRAYHYDDGADTDTVIENGRGLSPREEIGYIPWMFGIPENGREEAFKLLADRNAFFTDYGIATAEISHPRFLYEVGHECLWNGYVWPFATSQTLTALINVIRNYGCDESYKKLFFDLLKQYAVSHHRVREDGVTVPWIDEVRHPLRDEWSSRTMLRDWGWTERKGGYERGKDYNHSTFCDLVITGLVGVKTDGEALSVDPCVPKEWKWFRLKGLNFRGNTYDIIFDESGEKYGLGKGLTVKQI